MKKIFYVMAMAICAFPLFTSCGGSDDDEIPSSNSDEQKTTTTHEYVDLGLPSGTLWAKCNIGATSSDETGLYFAWGETTGYASTDKHTFDLASYKWAKDEGDSFVNLTKYCSDSYYGTVDGKSQLDAEDDAATVNWGPEWKMPTHAQMKELVEYTNSEWFTSINGVKGRKFISKKDATKFIFLPASYIYTAANEISEVGYIGLYQTSEINTELPYVVWDVWFNSSDVYADTNMAFIDRYTGMTVRAVRK